MLSLSVFYEQCRERPYKVAPRFASALQCASSAKSAQPLDLSSLHASMPKTYSYYVRLARFGNPIKLGHRIDFASGITLA